MDKQKMRSIIRGVIQLKVEEMLEEIESVKTIHLIHNRLFDNQIDEGVHYVISDESDKVYGQKVIDQIVEELTDYTLGKFKEPKPF